MNIILYKNKSDKHYLNKNIEQVGTISANLKGTVSIMNPVLILTIPPSYPEFNYLYIESSPFNGRYYYVTDIQVQSNNIATVTCKIDVLMSHREEILKETVILDRQESKINAYFTDSEIPVENRMLHFYKKFPSGLTDSIKYYLTIGG